MVVLILTQTNCIGVLLSSMDKVMTISPQNAEMIALYRGLKFVHDLGISNTIMLFDCKSLAEALNGSPFDICMNFGAIAILVSTI